MLTTEPAVPPTGRRVVFVFRGGREESLRAITEGSAPDEFLYGLPQFAHAGYRTAIIEARPGFFWQKPLLRPGEWLVTQLTGLGFPLTYALADLGLLQKADLVIATTDGTALPVLLLRRLGMIRSRVFVISQGLYRVADQLKGRPFGVARLRALAWLFRAADRIVVFGHGDADAFSQVFRGSSGPGHACIAHFGIDTQFWCPGPPQGGAPDILSVGSDALRDYETLLEAVGTRTCRIVTRRKLSPERIPATTHVDGDASHAELRNLYRSAKIVVTPLKDEPRDSGHSATLQAMACGRAVILSRTRGLWDREGLRHGENVWLVEPHNAKALREAMDRLLDDEPLRARLGRAAYAYVLSGHTSRDFGHSLVALAEPPSDGAGP